MKAIIIFFISFLCPLIINAQLEKSFHRLVEDNSSIFIDSTIMYVIDTNNRNRALQPHGVWRIRDKNKYNLLSIISYFDGNMHGHVLGYYPNGKIAHSVYYNFGIKNGPSVSFWQNGSAQASMYYENGVIEGVVKNFDTSAQLKKIFEVKKGQKEGIEIEFYFSGNIKVITQYLSGKENGLRREFKDDNTFEVEMEYEIRDGEKILGRFYNMGKLVRTENY